MNRRHIVRAYDAGRAHERERSDRAAAIAVCLGVCTVCIWLVLQEWQAVPSDDGCYPRWPPVLVSPAYWNGRRPYGSTGTGSATSDG